MRFEILLTLLGSGLALCQPAPSLLQEGIDAYRAAQYDEAIEDFEQAIAADPQSVKAHLYLGLAAMNICMAPGGAPERCDQAQHAFARVLELEPANLDALRHTATLADLRKNPDEARLAYLRLLEVVPNDKEAHLHLGILAWAKFYPVWKEARARAGMTPESPGPFKSASVRAALKKEWEPVLADGLSHLNRAVEIDPEYDDAMSYLNLIIRERADWMDSQYTYEAEMLRAEQWVKKAIEAKKRKAGDR